MSRSGASMAGCAWRVSRSRRWSGTAQRTRNSRASSASSIPRGTGATRRSSAPRYGPAPDSKKPRSPARRDCTSSKRSSPSTKPSVRDAPSPYEEPSFRIIVMSDSLAERLRSAKVYDLEQPRFFGMPIYPTHRPGYFYALYRRHRDTWDPQAHGPRTGSSGILTMMEHTGTHIDALCHQACGMKLFGDVAVEAAETPSGYTQHGIETVPPL